jgi:hypothetical protein
VSPGRARAGLARAAGWIVRTLVDPPLPLVAVEIRPRAVAAVRLAREGRRLSLGAAAAVDLPEGALEVSLAKANVRSPEALRAALRSALERVGALSGGGVSLVLPDPAVRVTLVPAAGVRGRRGEAEETVRFRLHKALPFDARGGRIAWAPVGGDQVLVAVALEEVLRGYEEALEELGYRPGLVEPASLALASVEAPLPAGDRLLVNWDHGYVSFVLLRGKEPLLLRTLAGEGDADAVTRHAMSTRQFHRDRLGGAGFADVVVRSAVVPGEEALAVLGRALETEPRLVEPWAVLGIREQGGPVQAVAGAAASALRRAA